MYVSAIVVAAGKSKRLGGKVSKALLKLNSKPIIAYSLDVLSGHHKINEIIIVGNRANVKSLRDIIKKNKIRKVRELVLGGKERQDSVSNGLRAINHKADYILIHDAARPFITKGLVSLVIKEALESKAVIVGVPVKSTIKRVTSHGAGVTVQETVDRRNLWEIQTPQVFSKDIILRAYKDCGCLKATDDASLVEMTGKKVKMVLGAHQNIKITTPEDLIIAEGIAKLWKPV